MHTQHVHVHTHAFIHFTGCKQQMDGFQGSQGWVLLMDLHSERAGGWKGRMDSCATSSRHPIVKSTQITNGHLYHEMAISEIRK